MSWRSHTLTVLQNTESCKKYYVFINVIYYKLSFGFIAKWDIIITFFSTGRIAAAEKHPLSYYMPQSDHGHSYCSVRNFPLTMHYGGKKLGESRGRDGRILTPTKGVPVYGVKFHQNWVRIATVREVTDTQTGVVLLRFWIFQGRFGLGRFWGKSRGFDFGFDFIYNTAKIRNGRICKHNEI